MKKWYESRTLWANIIAFVAVISTAVGVDLGLDPEQQAQAVAGIMAIVNIYLRITTKDAIG